MLSEYVSEYVGAVPLEETPIQAPYKTVEIDKAAYDECERFAKMLNKLTKNFRPLPSKFYVKTNDHDFGRYYSVDYTYQIDDELAALFYMFIEGDTPRRWIEDGKMERAAIDLCEGWLEFSLDAHDVSHGVSADTRWVIGMPRYTEEEMIRKFGNGIIPKDTVEKHSMLDAATTIVRMDKRPISLSHIVKTRIF